MYEITNDTEKAKCDHAIRMTVLKCNRTIDNRYKISKTINKSAEYLNFMLY